MGLGYIAEGGLLWWSGGRDSAVVVGSGCGRLLEHWRGLMVVRHWVVGRSSEGEERSVEEAEEGRTGHSLVARSLVSFGEAVRRWAMLGVVEGTLEM